MSTVGVMPLDFACYPSWNAHHWFIERRAEISDDKWAEIVSRPDWNDHAREDLKAEVICDRCQSWLSKESGTLR